jgi:hypothetical protein
VLGRKKFSRIENGKIRDLSEIQSERESEQALTLKKIK